MTSGRDEGSFFARWSRRKVAERQGVEAPDPVRVEPDLPIAPPDVAVQDATAPDAPPAPTLADAEALEPGQEIARFVAPDVDPGVRNAALKKLFADPHYNVMDGLDTYIDDYGKPDPIPPEMLRQLVQSKFLGLFDDEEEQAAAPALASPTSVAAADIPAAPPAPTPEADNSPPHEDAALRLQPDDAAGPPGAREGARPRDG